VIADGTGSALTVTPIGVVRGGREQADDDQWGGVEAVIDLDASRFGPDAVTGLEDFSHLEVVYLFHLVDERTVTLGARRPRGNPEWPEVGIFAQRAKARPNRLGVSRCRLLGVDGLRLRIAGLDAIDGTPVLDVKPWMAEFAPREPTRQPQWSRDLMRDYYS
jgi:tRNA (adenine37-N6)-methyltransferase